MINHLKLCSSPILLTLLLHSSIVVVEAKGKVADSGGLDVDTILYDYAIPILKVTLACSPILIIVGMLAFAREDEETENQKREEVKGKKCAKS